MACSQIPYATEQGIFLASQRIFFKEQGNPHARKPEKRNRPRTNFLTLRGRSEALDQRQHTAHSARGIRKSQSSILQRMRNSEEPVVDSSKNIVFKHSF
jgi:hypothetical protein